MYNHSRLYVSRQNETKQTRQKPKTLPRQNEVANPAKMNITKNTSYKPHHY
jgi:hypothetical protein